MRQNMVSRRTPVSQAPAAKPAAGRMKKSLKQPGFMRFLLHRSGLNLFYRVLFNIRIKQIINHDEHGGG